MLECLEAHVAPAMDALFRKLDRKREKALVRFLCLCNSSHALPHPEAPMSVSHSHTPEQVFQRRMELLAQLHASESPAEILVSAQQLRLIQAKGAVLLPSAAEADAALATSVPHLLALLGRTAAAVASSSSSTSEGAGEEGEAAGVGGVVGALEGAWAAYSAAEGDAEERGRLAQELLAAQAAVKEAFAKKDGAGGGGR